MSPTVDGKMENYLSRNVTPPLEAVVGAHLTHVVYWYSEEQNHEFISNSLFKTTGEVEIGFSNRIDVYLTWEHKAIVVGDVAIRVHPEGPRVDSYARCEANTTPLWAALVGTTLESVDVLGWGREVCAVKFRFGQRCACVGVGLVLRGSDDVFVRSADEFLDWPDANKGKVLWSAGEIE